MKRMLEELLNRHPNLECCVGQHEAQRQDSVPSRKDA